MIKTKSKSCCNDFKSYKCRPIYFLSSLKEKKPMKSFNKKYFSSDVKQNWSLYSMFLYSQFTVHGPGSAVSLRLREEGRGGGGRRGGGISGCEGSTWSTPDSRCSIPDQSRDPAGSPPDPGGRHSHAPIARNHMSVPDRGV